MRREPCERCHEYYDTDDRLQVIRHHGAFCVTSRAIDCDPEAKERRRQGAKRGWVARRKRMAQQQRGSEAQ